MSFHEQENENCCEELFCLYAFDTMVDAITALGNGQPFVASNTNTEGWEPRALLVTPEEITIICPSNVINTICAEGSGFEYVYEDDPPVLSPGYEYTCCHGLKNESNKTFLDEAGTMPCGGDGEPDCYTECGQDVYYEIWTVEDHCGTIASCVQRLMGPPCC